MRVGWPTGLIMHCPLPQVMHCPSPQPITQWYRQSAYAAHQNMHMPLLLSSPPPHPQPSPESCRLLTGCPPYQHVHVLLVVQHFYEDVPHLRHTQTPSATHTHRVTHSQSSAAWIAKDWWHGGSRGAGCGCPRGIRPHEVMVARPPP